MAIELKKLKTKADHVWDLAINGTVVGNATATYKTPTQRVWAGKISVPVLSGGHFDAEHNCANGNGNSVKTLINVFTAALEGIDIDVPEAVKPARKSKSKYPTVLRREDITVDNAIELGKHYEYSTVKKGGVERTGAEQAKYMRGILDKQKAAIPNVPMGDLVAAIKQGEPQVTSFADHYADE